MGDNQPIPLKLKQIMSTQHNLERLWSRLGMGRNEEVLKSELIEYEDCKAGLLQGIPNFLSKTLKLGGILGQQAETTLANGDFDTTFLILVCTGMIYLIRFRRNTECSCVVFVCRMTRSRDSRRECEYHWRNRELEMN
jgi:hypothetical protein